MTFISAVLGQVQHPTNILTEYLNRFRGVRKFKAYILSWLDGWINSKLKKGLPPWVYVVNQELAEALGCCRDTVFRHLKELCEMGILRKTPYKRWATDNIWAYSIDFEKLRQELSPSVDVSTTENQIADSRKSDSRLPGFVQPTAENQTLYISPIPNSSPVQPQQGLLAVVQKVKEEEQQQPIPEQKIVIPPTGEELQSAYSQISRLSSQVQTNLQVKTVIEKYWANFPAALERLKIAVQENWRCNLTGVLVKALKEGVPSEDATPPCAFFGWKEWADEAVRRRLMQYSQSQDGDIMVHFVSGSQMLWSRLRSLSWAEIERVASGGEIL